jgi:hypothetical protein
MNPPLELAAAAPVAEKADRRMVVAGMPGAGPSRLAAAVAQNFSPSNEPIFAA